MGMDDALEDRPFVIINVAQSLNGYIAGKGGKPVKISSDEDEERVHALRASVDGILVGINTILRDNPDLTARGKDGKILRPARIILDSRLRIPRNAKVLDSGSRTIIFTANSQRTVEGAEVRVMAKDDLEIPCILHNLYRMGIRKILVEGGANVIWRFLRAGTVDRFYLFIGNEPIPEGGIKLFAGKPEPEEAIKDAKVINGGKLLELDPLKLVTDNEQ